MKYSVRMALMTFFCGVILLVAGCGRKQVDQGEAVQVVGEEVTCIGVLPAFAPLVARGTAGAEKAKSLRQGTEMMDRLLHQELQGQAKIHFVGQDLLAGLALTGGENSLELAKMVGERIGCNAVMETRVSRFDERVGTKYSVEKAAAVAFDFRLIAIDTGAVLWSATFDEAQRSVTENLYEWKKAKSRGFTWVSAEALMQEGVRAKLGGSSYFSTGQGGSEVREPAAK